ncbi:MAG: beta-ketoacyl-ACP synthase III [Robiginitomaculum sp.]
MTSLISATGLWTPKNSISNDELVTAFNTWSDKWNNDHKAEIKAGTLEEKPQSNSEFILKASGIQSRFVISKDSILDPDIMAPRIPERPNEEISILAEIAVEAAKDALAKAGRHAKDIDAVIVACSNLQRGYPAIAVEVQDAIGAKGFAFDMNVACSSATFGIETARGLIAGGAAKSVLICNPEICTGHLNFKDRDSHFIFGDVATALLIEEENIAPAGAWKILGAKLATQFSNNIRNNFGFLNNASPESIGTDDKLFTQNGQKVFREVVPLVADMITQQLADIGVATSDLKRMWLHQANLSMNTLIAKKVMGKDVNMDMAPVVLDEYANTSSAGSIIAFDKHSADLKKGDIGLICSFGAGYSAGVIVVRKT